MKPTLRIASLAAACLCAVTTLEVRPSAQVAYRFADPARAEKLAAAFPAIDRLMRDFAERARVPGIAYGVLVDGRLAHQGVWGVRDVGAKAPVDVHTVFRIASMSKSFTAVAILQLRDEGKLALDDPAERYVPELAGLAYPTADSPRITIRHLLSHAEGFPEDNPWGDRQLAVTDDAMTRLMRQGIPFSTAPGTAYEYSNFGYAILGRIVARVSGQPFAQYLETRLLKPLGMHATTLEPGSVPAARAARGYRLEDGAWKEEPRLADGAFGAMGGLLSSTADLARYVAFMMSAWPPRDDPDDGPLRRASLREMQQVWRPSPASVSREASGGLRLNTGGYGFGLRVWQTCTWPHVVAHSGGLPGFGSHMRWLPEQGVAIIAMGNLTYTSWGRVADEAIGMLERTGALVTREPQPSPALIAARDDVMRLMEAWDDSVADRVAADTLYLDMPKERRRERLAALDAVHGACQAMPGRFDVENALRGSWLMACERGWLEVSITLAPTIPPKVQHWAVTPLAQPPRPVERLRNVCGQ